MHPLISVKASCADSRLSRPRIACWFILAVVILFNGLKHGQLPFSQSITNAGNGVAFLFVLVSCFLVVTLTAEFLVQRIPLESKATLIEYACVSLLIALVICLLPTVTWLIRECFIGQTFNPWRWILWIKVCLGILLFITLQAFATQALGARLRQRFLKIYSHWYSATKLDFVKPCLFVICFAEIATHGEKPYLQVFPSSFLLNVGFLIAIVIMVWAVTNRDHFALTLVIVGYFLLSIANAIKIHHLQAGLQIGDQSHLGELAELKGYFNTPLLCVVGAATFAVTGALVIAWHKSERKLDAKHRVWWLVCSLMAFAIAIGFFCFASTRIVLKHLGVSEKVEVPLYSLKQNGLLVELALQLQASYVSAPPNYNLSEVKGAIERQPQREENLSSKRHKSPPSLIVFFYESLTNPEDFGRRLSREVVPNFKSLQSSGTHGYTISPRFVGGSADSEFEFLTGMSYGFLPEASCAYKHYVKRYVPNLATSLRDSNGYHSTAVKCVAPDFYNFKIAYQYLQFDQFCFNEMFISQSSDKFSGYLSDDSFVDELLRPLTFSLCSA